MEAATESGTATPLQGTPTRRQPLRMARDGSAQELTRQPCRFYSCLDVPTDGSLPDFDFRKPPPESERNTDSVEPSRPPDSKRAPRKSKTEAIAALARGDSPFPAGDDRNAADSTPSPTKAGTNALSAHKLDFNVIKTTSPRVLPHRTTPRPFGLEDCPVFYPSLEDFKDPMKYIHTISPKAKEYGICKIVPPAGWKMPFVTDTEVSAAVVGIVACTNIALRTSVSQLACSASTQSRRRRAQR
jgi:[histone H3]-trimethyl-L-lysine4 demethylase